MVVFGVDGFQGINWNDTEYHCILLYVTVFSGLLKPNHSVLIIGGNILNSLTWRQYPYMVMVIVQFLEQSNPR